MNFAATEIQRTYRGMMGQVEVAMMMISSVKIQAVARGWLARKIAGGMLVERDVKEEGERLASITIQSLLRRAAVRINQSKRAASTLAIQRTWRGFVGRSEAR
tara:strand:- start:258 stop:566 length:309 start_codon:yes stop_codon:yes gene_type:complete